jgi:acyl-CoA reductase-like NAD-dependent aldehyde dehydrogenase
MKKQHLFINGKYLVAQTYYPLYSPYSGSQIAEVAFANQAEIDKALQAAEQAKKRMATMPLHERATILERFVELLKENEEHCAELIALESAKPIKVAKGEVTRTIMTYKLAAEEARRIHGETIPMDAVPGGEGRIAYTIRQPLGVVVAITPFNFPMNLVAHKVGPAIAAGNTIVLKPATQTPLSAYFIAELLQKAGLPDGALNVITGSGSVVGDQLVTDERVKKITFTGSPKVGMDIRNKAGLKKVTLELGSNSALIVDKDVDIESIITRVVDGSFAYAGQVCISIQRIFVHEEIYQHFVDQFVTKTKDLKLGDPMNRETDISALISKKDVERSLLWIKEAKALGADVVTGGVSENNILHPTVLLNVDPKAKISCQEAFAPVVLINKVTSIEEAIELVNESRYSLQAGVYTRNIHTAMNAAEKLEVGGVMINDIPSFRVDHMPYGGVKESGIGREGVKYAIEEMTELKLIVIKK